MNLCGPDGWKETVEVCLPLLAAHNTTAFPDAENQLQANNCSFAQAKIELRKPNPLPSPSISCTPMDGMKLFINPIHDTLQPFHLQRACLM